MSKLNVYLADLRHVRKDVMFADTMPLGIGYMKAVIDQEHNNEVNCEIFAYPDKFKEAIQLQQPDIVMFTNYMWNEALGLWFMNYVKGINPNILTVMGGPNVAIEKERQIQFMEQNPQIDMYVLGEGDFVASEIVSSFLKNDRNIEKFIAAKEIKSCIYSFNDEIIVENTTKRIRKLDEIPSPWLTGVMDKFFDNKLSPLYETNRGCPFTCTFCVQGTDFYKKVTLFHLERVKEELFYIANRIHSVSPNVKILRIADPNYGMYERDIEISNYMGQTQKKYEYPMFIDATTGKNKPERIIKAMEEVSGALIMWQSVQSLDDTVLTNVKRDNIKISTYNDINVYLKGRGLRSQADLILCLPGETLQTHKEALKSLSNAGVLRFNNFQAMLLKGSDMETKASRSHYGFESKYRLIQKNFSILDGDKIFETEEIIVSTESFSFDEYLIARKYHLIINLFLNELRFEKLLNFLDVLSVPRWDWIDEMYALIHQHGFMKKIAKEFEDDTKNELFDNEEDLINFYSKPDVFAKLETGEVGDNVVHKYRVISNYFNWDEVCDFAYLAARNVIEAQHNEFDNNNEFNVLWNDLKKYQYHTSAFGSDKESILGNSEATFTYDIASWIKNGFDLNFNAYIFSSATNVEFYLKEENKKNLNASLNRYNTDLVGMSLMIRKIKQHWLEKDSKVSVS